jgi:hypothetical protein
MYDPDAKLSEKSDPDPKININHSRSTTLDGK